VPSHRIGAGPPQEGELRDLRCLREAYQPGTPASCSLDRVLPPLHGRRGRLALAAFRACRPQKNVSRMRLHSNVPSGQLLMDQQ
jgi:hypothetical protein